MRIEDALAAAETVRRIVAAVDAGEVEASSTERAHLVGVADALDQLTADE